MAPPRPRPRPGLAPVGAGQARSLLQALFSLEVAAARARKRTGAEAVAAEAAEAAEAPWTRRLCTGLLEPRLVWLLPGSHAFHAPGPVGRLPAGLGGAAAGLPEHPGERQYGRPLTPNHLSLARGQGSDSRELRVRGQGSWHRSRGRRGPELQCPIWTLLSASHQCPTEAPFARAAATPGGSPCSWRTSGPLLGRASERGPDPDPVFFQESGRLSPNRPGPVLGQSLSKHAQGPGPAGASIQPPGLSAAVQHPGRQPDLGSRGEVVFRPVWGRGRSRMKDSAHEDWSRWLLQRVREEANGPYSART